MFVDSEFGILREALLSFPPKLDKRARLDSPGLAYPVLANSLLEKLETLLLRAGVACHWISPSLEAPYQCYMRDSTVVTPWGLIVCRLASKVRRLEPTRVTEWAAIRQAPIWRVVTEGFCEGGDVLVLRPGYVAIAYDEVRTTKEGAGQVGAWFSEKGWNVHLIHNSTDHGHLDVLVSTIDDRTVIYADCSIDDESLVWLQDAGFKTLVPVPATEAYVMGCNLLSLGEGRVLSSAQAAWTNKLLRSLGFEVLEPDLSVFVADAGGPHCLVSPWRREPAKGRSGDDMVMR